MGSFFCDVLSFNHEVAIFDAAMQKLRYTFNAQRFATYDEIKAFEPELLINAVTVKYTIDAFHKVMPYLPNSCIISDIASVKNGLPEFYASCGHPFVSTHPMFGPTFASLNNLSSENAIIISQSDHLGKVFFKDLYNQLHLNIFEYTFDEHDETIAFSLSIPFASTLVFGSVMKHQDAPHGHCSRTDVGRRLPSARDFIQPSHQRTTQQNQRSTHTLAINYRRKRQRGNESISRRSAREYQITARLSQH